MPSLCARCKRELKPSRPKKAKASVKAIRAAVMERAGNCCECGCGRMLSLNGAQMDHWLGGSGRRREKQSVETCWMLTMRCHERRTRNELSVAWWNERFRSHCTHYGYEFTPHIEKRPVTRVA